MLHRPPTTTSTPNGRREKKNNNRQLKPPTSPFPLFFFSIFFTFRKSFSRAPEKHITSDGNIFDLFFSPSPNTSFSFFSFHPLSLISAGVELISPCQRMGRFFVRKRMKSFDAMHHRSSRRV